MGKRKNQTDTETMTEIETEYSDDFEDTPLSKLKTQNVMTTLS